MNSHDAELPRGFQDADFEARSLTNQANHEASLRRRGLCPHSWIQGPPGHHSKPTKVWTCLDCGKAFDTEAALHADRESILEGHPE